MNRPVESDTASTLANDAGAFMQQLDLVQRRSLFVRLNEAELRAASFLDERVGLQGREGLWLPLTGVAAVASAIPSRAAPPDFIFHIGHCGSTLLSRLLDQADNVLGLREPLVLRELAAAGNELDTPVARLSATQWNRLFLDSLAILGRGFSEGQHVIIKATSTCNNLIEPVLEHVGSSRVLLLHLRLDSYLATMLKAPGGGVDALIAAPARLAVLHRALGEDTIRLHQLDPAETVAMGWAAELIRFLEIKSRHADSQRVMLLDFENLLGSPSELLDAVRTHFGLSGGSMDNAALLQSPVMRAYAKSPAHAYSPDDRAHDLDLSRRRFSDEIARGTRWVEKLANTRAQLAPLLPLLR